MVLEWEHILMAALWIVYVMPNLNLCVWEKRCCWPPDNCYSNYPSSGKVSPSSAHLRDAQSVSGPKVQKEKGSKSHMNQHTSLILQGAVSVLVSLELQPWGLQSMSPSLSYRNEVVENLGITPSRCIWSSWWRFKCCWAAISQIHLIMPALRKDSDWWMKKSQSSSSWLPGGTHWPWGKKAMSVQWPSGGLCSAAGCRADQQSWAE